GPFVDFVAAAWSDLGFAEFKGRNGEPQPLVDAIGNRVVKFHRRREISHGAQSRTKNSALCPKPPRHRRASSHPTNRR
ncbi:hypothetical protein, partial [Bradyrhizobium ivorense]|uniref:hypothetical protein n=1 Tax=Bradyrhizobium ivorense TaxID=2511166 RepID=UPI001E3FCF43